MIGDRGLGTRLGLTVIELAVLGAAWWYLKLDNVMAGAIAAVIVISNVLPPRWGNLASGIGMLGLAALAQVHYRQTPVALVLGVFGAVTLLSWFTSLRK